MGAASGAPTGGDPRPSAEVLRFRVATRGSPLARWQTALVCDLLSTGAVVAGQPVSLEPVIVETAGDRRRDVPLSSIGGQGVFVKEVQAAVLEGRADLAVHSAKDLPSTTEEGLVLAAVPERDDPRDALVGSALAAIPTGGRVGTGSVRRRAQLAHVRPDLTFEELRGNIDTRLAKAAGFDAIVMAAAALRRLGRADRIAEALDPATFVPQAGQGALAIECREDDASLIELLRVIEHPFTRAAVDAERAFLDALGGGCSIPAGAYATVDGDDLQLTGMIASGDGRVVLRHSAAGTRLDPAEVGRRVAGFLLDDAGGRSVLTGDDSWVS